MRLGYRTVVGTYSRTGIVEPFEARFKISLADAFAAVLQG